MKKHTLPACNTIQYLCIMQKLKEQFKKAEDTEGYFYRCRQRCTPRCSYHQYASLISYSKFPSDDARRFTVSEAEWVRMKNTIIIDIYYEKLEYTLIKHYRAMTIHGFIANLGGQYAYTYAYASLLYPKYIQVFTVARRIHIDFGAADRLHSQLPFLEMRVQEKIAQPCDGDGS